MMKRRISHAARDMEKSAGMSALQPWHSPPQIARGILGRSEDPGAHLPNTSGRLVAGRGGLCDALHGSPGSQKNSAGKADTARNYDAGNGGNEAFLPARAGREKRGAHKCVQRKNAGRE